MDSPYLFLHSVFSIDASPELANCSKNESLCVLIRRIFWYYVLITPHAQREWGKVIGCGVHIHVSESAVALFM